MSDWFHCSSLVHWLTGPLAHWPSMVTGFLSPDFRLNGFLDFWLSRPSSALRHSLQFGIPWFCRWLQSHSSLLWHPKMKTSFSIGIYIIVIVVVFMDIASTKSQERTQSFLPRSAAHCDPTLLKKPANNLAQLLVLQMLHSCVTHVLAPMQAKIRRILVRNLIEKKIATTI